MRACHLPSCPNAIDPGAPPHRKYCSPECLHAAATEFAVIGRAVYQQRNPQPARPESPERIRLRQLSAYFRILIGLAEKADSEQRNDLFDRIERCIDEAAKLEAALA